MGLIKISLFQKAIPEPLGPSAFKKLSSLKSDFLVLPEYVFADSSVRDHASGLEKSRAALEWMTRLSDAYKGIIVGGTVILEEDGKLFNACPIVYGSQVVDYYRKRHLTEKEKNFFAPGAEAGVFILGGFRFGVLICADVLKPETLDELASMGIKLVFTVMNSPYKEESVQAKRERDDRLYCQPAARHKMVIAKCCGAGSTFGQRIQGRSLVATSSGISWRVSPDEEDKEIIKTVIVQAPGV